MDYKIEFERLMAYVKQALSGVDVDKREVSGFAGLLVLSDVFQDYENRLAQPEPDDCSYSPDKIHHFDGDTVEICSYCEGRRYLPETLNKSNRYNIR